MSTIIGLVSTFRLPLQCCAVEVQNQELKACYWTFIHSYTPKKSNWGFLLSDFGLSL